MAADDHDVEDNNSGGHNDLRALNTHVWNREHRY